MLQRAASSAYSWWWASSIRTKQSKWLDTNLEEMEDRTKSMLKIIEEDGDSFARKAEMYFKKRPELIEIVEETYKAYKALADRYDHISSELHKANHTIATAFPDQIHFDPQDEDDDNLPETITNIDPSKLRKPPSDIPQIPLMSKRKENSPALKKSRIMKSDSPGSKEKAEEEIGRLQKGILVLQTEKEFLKICYEERVTKYLDIDKKMNEMQEEVFLLQDGYSTNVVIDDDEARNLMAVSALKSCEDTLNKLQEEQKRSIEETRIQTERIKIGKENIETESSSSSVQVKENVEIGSNSSMEELAEKINELVSKLISLEVTASSQTAQMKSMRLESDELHKNLQNFEKEKKSLIEDSNSLQERLKKAEELLETKNNLEVTASSQTAQMKSMRLESDELRKNLQNLEKEKKALIEESNSLQERLKKAEELLETKNIEEKRLEVAASSQAAQMKSMRLESDEIHKNLQNLEKEKKSLIEYSNSLQERLKKAEELLETKNIEEEKRLAAKACLTIGDTSDELLSSKPKEQVSVSGSFKQSETSVQNIEATLDYSKSGVEEKEILGLKKSGVDGKNMMDKDDITETQKDSGKTETTKRVLDRKRNLVAEEAQRIRERDCRLNDEIGEHEVSVDCLQSLPNGSEGNEKNILAEYTAVLRNCKEAKNRLSEAEKKNHDYRQEAMEQIKKLERANVSKDEEIRSLQRTLKSLLTNIDNNADTHSCQGEGSSIQPRHERNLSSFEAAYENFLVDEDTRQLESNEHHATSGIEEQFRKDIDTLFEENLEFWLRFSTSFQSIQKFQTDFDDLQAETEKLRNNKSDEGSSSHSSSGKTPNPESQVAEKQLRELKRELQVWLEQHRMMQTELQTRFSSLGSIQDDISGALELSLQEGGVQFPPYQAAKFHGELLNIEMENKKVSDELQAGLDHVTGLKTEVEKILSKLHTKFEMPESTKTNNQNLNHMTTKGRGVPLRSFLFTGKPKKKQSILGCVHPALQKHTHDLANWRPK